MEKSNLIKEYERLDDLQLNNLMIIQNPNEYCFTSDAVALANFAKCAKGEVVVDLCSGSGVIGILISAKCSPSHVHLVELQNILADMSDRSVKYNDLQDIISVHNAPLQGISSVLGVGKADMVVCNPPYKKSNMSKLGEKKSINIAKHEIEVTLEEIILESAKLLKFGGKFYTINKEERLADIIVEMRKNHIEPKIIKILSTTKYGHIVMVQGIKNGKSGLKVELG